MRVDRRSLHLAHGRLEYGVPYARQFADKSKLHVETYAGLDARTLLSGAKVDGALLGQNLSFKTGGRDSLASAFTGFRFQYDNGTDMLFFAMLEGLMDIEKTAIFTSNLGLKLRF